MHGNMYSIVSANYPSKRRSKEEITWYALNLGQIKADLLYEGL